MEGWAYIYFGTPGSGSCLKHLTVSTLNAQRRQDRHDRHGRRSQHAIW